MTTTAELVLSELSLEDLVSCTEPLRRGPHFFLETVLATLSCEGRLHLQTDLEGREGVGGAVAMMDEIVERLVAAGRPWSDAVPFVRIAACTRPSSMGGLENWRTQLAWFDGLWLEDRGYGVLRVRMPLATARHMLEGRPAAYVRLARTFADRVACPVRG